MIIKAKQKSGSLNLTKKADYGLFLLATLAQKTEEQNSIKTIAEKNDLSFSFLQKVAGALQQGGLIIAERGKFGGYKLTKKPDKITIKEILETLEGPIAITPCFLKAGKNSCLCSQEDFCKIKTGLKKMNEEIKQTLLSKTLNQLI